MRQISTCDRSRGSTAICSTSGNKKRCGSPSPEATQRGKSTLVSELAKRHPEFTAIDEPYHLLADEGHAFADPPISDDFELLLDRSISLLSSENSIDVLFDRSPADYVAYLAALERSSLQSDAVARVAELLAKLDLVVFVPIERPDRLADAEAPRLRRDVDRILREMLIEGEWGFDVPVVEVSGTTEQRADQVHVAMSRLAAQR